MLKSTGAPVVWRSVALACQIPYVIGLNRARWTARRAFALRRAGNYRRAASVYLVAMGGGARAELPQVLARIRQEAGAREAVPASWLYGLGLCLRRLGDLDESASAHRLACDWSPDTARLFEGLSLVEEQRGDFAAAITAAKRAIDLRGDVDPRLRYRLATLRDQTGEWAEAAGLLAENITLFPDHAASHKLRADVLDSMSTWGGTFTGTAAGRTQGEFCFGEATGDTNIPVHGLIRDSLEKALRLAPTKTSWRADLANALATSGQLAGAIKQYERALREADKSTGRWVLGAKQRWQFHLEAAHNALGNPRVEDPLFDCKVEPLEARTEGAGQIAGLFRARFTHVGLAISGIVAAGDGDMVEIVLNGVPIRTLNLSNDGFLPRFSIALKRRTLALMPNSADLQIRTIRGALLRGPRGAEMVRLTVPHGNGELLGLLAEGGKLDKKGVISHSPEATRLRQERYLEIYAQVRDFFENHLGRSVFLMYGTLLGHYRDGDFIPGDDDFDAGYVSDKKDPVAVKEETKRIIVKLVQAGFTVSFNRRGRLFRVQLERGATDGYHVDLRPVWFEDGNIWVHNHVCLPGSREDFVPVVDGTLRGVPVSIPRNTEAFLRGHYGPGWKVPDPGFTYYASEVDQTVRNNLNKALITVAEYNALAEKVRSKTKNSPAAGRFVSIGSQDLYPLDEYIS